MHLPGRLHSLQLGSRRAQRVGVCMQVESHPFDVDSMLFMDWRDDHTTADPTMQESNHK